VIRALPRTFSELPSPKSHLFFSPIVFPPKNRPSCRALSPA
jgi:hypothetical protein